MEQDDSDNEAGREDRSSEGLESTLHLLERVRAGDPEALNRLYLRFLPRLTRWASGRLSPRARDLVDTQDIVQETLIHAVDRLHTFEHRGEGSLQAYLRQALRNRLQDQLRRVHRRPLHGEIDERAADPGPSPLEQTVGIETLERYDAAMDRLKDEDRAAIVARIEMGLPFQEVARMLGKNSADAARMAVTRALVRLTKEMSDDGR